MLSYKELKKCSINSGQYKVVQYKLMLVKRVGLEFNFRVFIKLIYLILIFLN